jgi:hypothetical protein
MLTLGIEHEYADSRDHWQNNFRHIQLKDEFESK